MSLARARAALAAALALAALPAAAQFWKGRDVGAGPPPDAAPAVLEDVRVDEQLGARVPLDAALVDWTGKAIRLGDVAGRGKPVVLALVYYECPMLCGLIQSGLARSIRESGLVLGKDFEAVSISFEPEETPRQAAERRRGYLQSVGHDLEAPGAWSFLLSPGEGAKRIADAVGFHYAKDPATGEWAHVAAIFVLTPDGRVSRYLYGIEWPARDFRLALVEASEGKVGTAFDKILLTCFRYDPASRKYEPYALGFVRLGGLLAAASLGTLIAVLLVRERRRARPTA